MRPSRWERLKNDQGVLAALFLLPTLLVLMGVVVYPFCSAVWISFQAKQAGTPGRFTGLQNYAELPRQPGLPPDRLEHDLLHGRSPSAIKFLLGLLAALVLAPERRLNGLYRTVLFVPWAVPTVIAALNWRWVYDEFSGMLNNVLLALGLTQNVVAWLGGTPARDVVRDRRRGVDGNALLHDELPGGAPGHPQGALRGRPAGRRVDPPGVLPRDGARDAGRSSSSTVMLSTVFTSTSLVGRERPHERRPGRAHQRSCRTSPLQPGHGHAAGARDRVGRQHDLLPAPHARDPRAEPPPPGARGRDYGVAATASMRGLSARESARGLRRARGAGGCGRSARSTGWWTTSLKTNTRGLRDRGDLGSARADPGELRRPSSTKTPFAVYFQKQHGHRAGHDGGDGRHQAPSARTPSSACAFRAAGSWRGSSSTRTWCRNRSCSSRSSRSS